MDASLTAIEVSGFPSGLAEDRTIDKLTIHFLRERNGGGEVLRVAYTRHDPRRAIVVFENPDVAARVLQREHVLQLGPQSYPLTVGPVDLAEVDLPVRATLDLSMFKDQHALRTILQSHSFKITRQFSGQLLLEGSFLNLSAARVKLAELLSSEGQSQSSYPVPRPSVHSEGAAAKRGLPSYTDVSYRQNRAVMGAGSWSSEGAKSSPTSMSSVTTPLVRLAGSAGNWSNSPPEVRPSSHPHRDDEGADMSYRQNRAKVGAGSWSPEGAKSSPTSMSSVTPPPVRSAVSAGNWSDSPPGGRPSAHPRHDDNGASNASFLVDALTLSYARSFRGYTIQGILREHGAEMKVVEGSEFSTIVLTGRGAPRAEEKLAALLREEQASLRTQEIPLPSMSEERHRLVGRARQLAAHRQVLVIEGADALQLVGSSIESYELKRRILGEEASRRAEAERGRQRGRQRERSASLSRRPAGGADARDPEARSAEAGADGPSPGGAKGPRGAADSTRQKDPRYKRSLSESRAKEAKSRPAPGDNHRAPPAGTSATLEREQTPKKSSTVPAMNKSLIPNFKNVFSKK